MLLWIAERITAEYQWAFGILSPDATQICYMSGSLLELPVAAPPRLVLVCGETLNMVIANTCPLKKTCILITSSQLTCGGWLVLPLVT